MRGCLRVAARRLLPPRSYLPALPRALPPLLLLLCHEGGEEVVRLVAEHDAERGAQPLGLGLGLGLEVGVGVGFSLGVGVGVGVRLRVGVRVHLRGGEGRGALRWEGAK